MEKKQKRERSTNFSVEETNLLVSLVEAKIHVIENKKSDASTWQEKEKAWKDIEKAFNSTADSVFRDHIHLKLKYEALKRDTRKKSAMIRSERYRTGGGTSIVPPFTFAEEKVKGMILLSVEENESQFDSDSVLPNSSKNITLEIMEQENEPPKKKVCNESQKETSLQSDNIITENQWKEWNPMALKCKKHPVLSKQKEKRPFDKLTEEQLEIAKIQKKVFKEDLEQKLIQRKLLEKELEHKEIIYELEKQYLLLKIKLLKQELGEI